MASFSEREDFADVKRVPQNDGPNPVVSIAYADSFVETMDYFRAMVHAHEKTPRALEVVTEAIDENPGNYTAWAYRRDILEALGSDLKEELQFVSEMAEGNPKNYQLWFHRRWVVEKLGDSCNEIGFIDKALEEDSKNYHAWSHRVWVVSTFNLWADELPAMERLVDEDIRNNSAWNHRYYVIKSTTGWTDEVIKRELEYAETKIKLAPNNESPWNYLNGVLDSVEGKSEPVLEFCRRLSAEHPECPFPLRILARSYRRDGSAEAKTKEIETYKKLAEIDPVRKVFWSWKAAKAEES